MEKIIISFLLCALLLVSCGNPEGNDEGDSRKELILATIISTPTLQRQVYDFNQSNSDYYITINDYFGRIGRNISLDEFNSRWDDAMLRLDVDIVASGRRSKTSLDIIVLPSYYDHFRYARKGYFEDLTSFINEDKYISVLDVAKIDNKLYGIFPYFRFSAIIRENVPSDGDLFDTLVSLQNEADYSIVGMLSRSWDLVYWISFYIDEFIDWKNMECEFNHPRFIAIAEMLKIRPTGSEPDTIDEYTEMLESMMDAMREKPFFIPVEVNSIYAIQGWKNVYGRNAVYTGFPANENMLLVLTDEIYAIPRNSKNKKVAWEFISGIIDEDYQMKNAREYPGFPGIPILWDAVELTISNSQNEKSTFVEWSYWIDDPQFNVSYVEPDIPELFRSLLNKEWRIDKGDDMMNQIISEEMEFYFNDAKTLEQVIELINNRVGLYLKENM